MTASSMAPERLSLTDGTINPDAGRAASVFNSAAPLVLGLVAPLSVLMLLDPTVLRHGKFLLLAVMVPLLLAAVTIYVYSVLNPGDVAAVVADRSRRVLELHQANAFTSRRTLIGFEDITGVRMVESYDHDGYSVDRAEITLASGETIGLPFELGEAEVRSLRSMLGLAGGGRQR